MKTLGNISLIASIIGFLIPYFSDSQNPAQTNFFQYTCLAIFALSSVYQLYLYRESRPKKFKNKAEIDKYMFNWINKEGQTIIFTRDMSWADSEGMIEMLKVKANKKELTIVLSKATLLTNDLIHYGAEILFYGESGFTPQSRFTIIRAGRSDAKVAIGRRYADEGHIIEEFDNNNHPLFYVATDLVELIRRKRS